MILHVPDHTDNRLRVHRGRLVAHLGRTGVRELLRAPDVNERVVGDLAGGARRDRAHRVLAVHDAEEVLAAPDLGALSDLVCEGKVADARASVAVHVSEVELGEAGLCLPAKELAIGQGAVGAAERMALWSVTYGRCKPRPRLLGGAHW